jgi:integrase
VRQIGKLTARRVATVRAPGLYADGGNLYLKVGDNGAKSWIVRWSSSGKVHKLGLGAVHTVSLADARERAADVRRAVLDGIDPRAVTTAKTISFADAAEQYIESHQAGWKSPRYAEQWRLTLDAYANPVFGKIAVDAIDTGMVLQVLQPIWTTKTSTAFQLRARIERVLSWCKVHKYRSGENPAAWRGHLDHLLPRPNKVRKVVHHAALPIDQLPGFMRELRQQPGIVPRALEFLILTASRLGETRNATWPEIDLANKVWTVPAGRMKAGKEHRVPLSSRTINIVQEMQTIRRGDYVFPGQGRRPIGDTSFAILLRRMSVQVTTHGFRSCFRDWAAERTDTQNHIVEMALAHSIGDRVEASYRRGDLFEKRRQLMNAWGDFCTG